LLDLPQRSPDLFLGQTRVQQDDVRLSIGTHPQQGRRISRLGQDLDLWHRRHQRLQAVSHWTRSGDDNG
jgi:hypothetical protein